MVVQCGETIRYAFRMESARTNHERGGPWLAFRTVEAFARVSRARRGACPGFLRWPVSNRRSRAVPVRIHSRLPGTVAGIKKPAPKGGHSILTSEFWLLDFFLVIHVRSVR